MILTVDQVRQHINSDLSDEALERLMDAAEALIVERAGAPGARAEIIGAAGRWLTLNRPVSSISSITELIGTSSLTTLAADDYLQRSPYVLERLVTGTNPQSRWRGRVTVSYTPVDDDPIRAEVQLDLLRAALSYTPGMTGQQIGSWSEQYAANSAWNNAAERDAILDRLNGEPQMVVV